MRSLGKVEGTLLIGTVEKCAIQINDDKYTAWLRETFRREVCLG
jgi:hypothetical protein